MEKRAVIASDHAGFAMKETLMKRLEARGIEYTDLGAYSTDSVDYPVFADSLCAAVSSDQGLFGVLICGTGIGMSIAANKHKGIRAALCSDTFSARMCRMHNDANVLCLGARVIGEGLAADILDAFIDSSFEGGKHQRRVDMLTELDKKI